MKVCTTDDDFIKIVYPPCGFVVYLLFTRTYVFLVTGSYICRMQNFPNALHEVVQQIFVE